MRYLIILKRYPLEPLADIFVISLTFVAIYFGIDFSLEGEPKNLTSLFLSYCLGILSMILISEMGMNIAREAQLGTLERIYTMPSRLFRVITVRSFVSLFFSVVKLSVFAGLFIVLLKVRVSITGGFISVFIAFMISLLGIGYILSGLTLKFKRIGELAAVLQLYIFFLP